MKRIDGVRATLPPPRSREVEEEFQFHLETRTQALIAAGWEASAARDEALRQFGDMSDAATYCRELDRARNSREGRLEMMTDLWRDARTSTRALLKAPGFFIVAVVTIALGVGANVAVYGMLRGVLIDPIPVPRPERLVVLFQTTGVGGELANQISYGDYVDLRGRKDLFEDVALIENASVTVVDGRGADRVQGRRASPALFHLLGVTPALGRVFSTSDATADDQSVVVSYDYWTARLGADPQAIGKLIRLGPEQRTIIGVLPSNFGFPYPSAGTQIWFPLNDTPDRTTNRHYWGYWAVARSSANMSPERTQSELDALARALQREHAESNAERWFTSRDLATTVVGDRRTAMLALVSGAIFVLLIACTNLTNLLLVRASGRRRELAIRTALGSGVRRLVRMLALETLLVSLAGGVVGTVLAAVVLRLVSTLDTVTMSRLDSGMLIVAGGLSVVAGLGSSIWPSVVAVRMASSGVLGASPRTSLGRGQRRIADVLVAAEVGLCLVLLVSASLMFMTVARALSVDAGFNRRNVLAFRVYPARDRYPDLPSTMALYRRLSEAIESIPGTTTPVFASALPLANRMGASITREDRPAAPGTAAPTVVYSAVSPGYFQTMSISLLAGRDFTERDLLDSTHVAIVSQRTAREVFGGENPMGRRIALGGGTDWHTIIGVVADVRQDSVTGEAERGAYDLYGEHWNRGMYAIVRATSSPRTLLPSIRDRVRAIDAELPVYEVGTMEERAAKSIVNRRFLLRILGVFGGIALLLCAVGIYGVTSQAVAQRRRELAIRMALGASADRVERGVIGRAAMIVGVGTGLGGVAAIAVTDLLRALVYGVTPTDPRAFLAGGLILVSVALVTAWIPARRAARVDPAEVLRVD